MGAKTKEQEEEEEYPKGELADSEQERIDGGNRQQSHQNKRRQRREAAKYERPHRERRK